MTSLSPTPAAAPRRPHGFTTIELMVVIAIILVLMGIVVFGYRRVATGSQENQTRTILERLRNMQGVVTGNKTASQKFFQSQIPNIYATPIGYAATDSSYAANVVSPTNTAYWKACPAGSDDTLYRTGLVLNALMATPEARAVFDELPANRKQRFFFVQTTGERRAASAPGVTVEFVIPLDAWGNPVRFVFDNWQLSSSGTTSQLRILTGGEATGGLVDLYSESAKGYWELPAGVAQPAPTALPYVYERSTRYPAFASLGQTNDHAFRSPDRQPFWVSAGPDGNFQTHDDNVYSFEN